jgi:thiol-disulfide isomerase/thioredoxin
VRRRALIGVTAAAAVGAAAFVLVQASSVSRDGVAVGVKTARAACPETGHQCLPELTYVDTAGNAWTPELLAGKVVMVNFWATWCNPCLREIPALASAYRTLGDEGFVILGVLVDDVAPPVLERFVERTGLNYPVVEADDEILSAFGYPDALPMTYLYARDGTLTLQRRGEISSREIDANVTRLLQQQGGAGQ